MPTYGQRPDDVVQDSRGNALSGVLIKLYNSESSASADGTPVATATTDERGRWTYVAAAGELWARLPDATVWQITDANNLEDFLNITEGDARYYPRADADAAVAAAVADKSDTGHAHDERYYTETETDALLATKADDADVVAALDRSNHTGTQDVSTITGLTDAVADDLNAALVMGDFISKFYDSGTGQITLSVSPPGFRGEWATGNIYFPGNTVARSGDLYHVKAVASFLSTPPESDATHYELMVTAGGGGGGAVAWGDVTGKPTEFTPSTHTHAASQVSDSTATGRAVLTAASTAAARTAVEAVGSTTVTQIAVLTQAAYDALGAPDGTTLYIIVG